MVPDPPLRTGMEKPPLPRPPREPPPPLKPPKPAPRKPPAKAARETEHDGAPAAKPRIPAPAKPPRARPLIVAPPPWEPGHAPAVPEASATPAASAAAIPIALRMGYPRFRGERR